MWELSLKLAATALILVIALAGWILDHKWKAGRTRAQKLWARLLLGFICAGAVVNGFVIWHSHSDGQEQKERIARIDHGVVELVKLARERNPNLTEQEALGNIAAEVRALRQRTSELDRELDGVKRYGNVAELNAFGLKGLAGYGLRETSPTLTDPERSIHLKTSRRTREILSSLRQQRNSRLPKNSGNRPRLPIQLLGIVGMRKKGWRQGMANARQTGNNNPASYNPNCGTSSTS